MKITIRVALQTATPPLKALTRDSNQAWIEAERLLAHVLHRDRSWLIAHGNERLSASASRSFARLMRRRLRHEPLAYLLGSQIFYGREFFVDRRVLIPRPETEELVERARRIIESSPKPPIVWDVGTGSGAIAITIKKERPTIRVIASDVDAKALALAKKNARRLKAKDIKFVQANLFDKKIERLIHSYILHPTSYFLVLANLPYLPLSDKRKLMPSVIKFEPSKTLFTKENGLFLIHRLLQQLSNLSTRYEIRDTRF